MAFVTSLDASADSRRAERRSVNSVFSAFAGRGGPTTVIVHNISETGFRAEFSSELQVGDEVRLQLGKGTGFVTAEVVWRDGWDHGCRFTAPISEGELRGALDTLTPVVGSEEDAQATPLDNLLAKPQSNNGKRRMMLLIVLAVLLGEAILLIKLFL